MNRKASKPTAKVAKVPAAARTAPAKVARAPSPAKAAKAPARPPVAAPEPEFVPAWPAVGDVARHGPREAAIVAVTKRAGEVFVQFAHDGPEIPAGEIERA